MTVEDLIRKLSRFKKNLQTNVKDITIDYADDEKYVILQCKYILSRPSKKSNQTLE
jgi:hypothetical protein